MKVLKIILHSRLLLIILLIITLIYTTIFNITSVSYKKGEQTLAGKVIKKNVDTDGARSIIAEYVYNGQTYQTDISQGYSRNDFLNLSIDAPVNLMISAEHPDYAITEKGADFTKKWTPVIIAVILLFLVCVLFYNFIVE